MHRSASTSRVSDQSFAVPPSRSPSPPQRKSSAAAASDGECQLLLPRYDPLSHVAKKERSRLRSAEIGIHFIPLVLVICAAILWFFSHPALIS